MIDVLRPSDAGYQRMAQAFYGPLDQAFNWANLRDSALPLPHYWNAF
ncbi:hypothetical protein [Actinacidiphila oryziradicis]|nr:hypothetical protein [Actinacidiphila oryziradicis]